MRIPELQRVIVGTGNDARAVRAESRSIDRVGMAGEGHEAGARMRIPELQRFIVGTGNDARAVRAESRSTNPAGMAVVDRAPSG